MRRFLLPALLLIPAFVWAQGGSYTINGKLPTAKASAKLYLVQLTAGKTTVDSTRIQDGAFSFKGSVSEPLQARLVTDKPNTGHVSLYLEPGAITISSPDSLANAVVNGTPLNDANQKLITLLRPTTEKMNQLSNEYRSATPEQWKSKEFMGPLEKREEAISDEQKKIRAQFIKENPASLVSLYELRRYDYAPNYADVKPLFDGLSDAVKNSRLGKEYATLLTTLKTTSVGAIAPEFTQADTSGKAVALSSFRGKYVLIDFWASWCGPCRQENPNVVKNFQAYKDKNFTVLGISLDRPNGKEAWLKAIRKDRQACGEVSQLKD